MAVGFCLLSRSSIHWRWLLCGLQPLSAGVLQITLRGSVGWRQLLHCCSALLVCRECAALAEGAIRFHYTCAVLSSWAAKAGLRFCPCPLVPHWQQEDEPELTEQLASVMPSLGTVFTVSLGAAGLQWLSELSEESLIFLTAFYYISLTGSKALPFFPSSCAVLQYF